MRSEQREIEKKQKKKHITSNNKQPARKLLMHFDRTWLPPTYKLHEIYSFANAKTNKRAHMFLLNHTQEHSEWQSHLVCIWSRSGLKRCFNTKHFRFFPNQLNTIDRKYPTTVNEHWSRLPFVKCLLESLVFRLEKNNTIWFAWIIWTFTNLWD